MSNQITKFMEDSCQDKGEARQRILTSSAKNVTEFDSKLRTLAGHMASIMHGHKGIGLAAPQIGVGLRLCIIEIPGTGTTHYICNPEIVHLSKKNQLGQEGCLSLPGVFLPTRRPKYLRFMYQDLEGKHYEQPCEGLFARAVCHELDHLDGKLFIHRLSEKRCREIVCRIGDLKERGKW